MKPITIDSSQWSHFDYPIDAFLSGTGCWNYSAAMGEPDTTETNAEMMNYNHFEEVYHFQIGENDEDDWQFVVKHKNGYYVTFDACCDYTGFDCQGGGVITYSATWDNFWKFGLTEELRHTVSLLE